MFDYPIHLWGALITSVSSGGLEFRSAQSTPVQIIAVYSQSRIAARIVTTPSHPNYLSLREVIICR